MHTFTLSLFSSSLTPTGSNKGCSITRGNSYLYNKEHLTIFSFTSTSYFPLFMPLNNVACKFKSFFRIGKKVFPFQKKLEFTNFVPRLIQWKLISSSSSLYLYLSLLSSFRFTYIFINNFSKSLLFSIMIFILMQICSFEFHLEFTS